MLWNNKGICGKKRRKLFKQQHHKGNLRRWKNLGVTEESLKLSLNLGKWFFFCLFFLCFFWFFWFFLFFFAFTERVTPLAWHFRSGVHEKSLCGFLSHDFSILCNRKTQEIFAVGLKSQTLLKTLPSFSRNRQAYVWNKRVKMLFFFFISSNTSHTHEPEVRNSQVFRRAKKACFKYSFNRNKWNKDSFISDIYM